jgi:predicted GNAT family acetyltransferase
MFLKTNPQNMSTNKNIIVKTEGDKMFEATKKNFENEVQNFARNNIIRKLEKQGIDYKELSDDALNDLIREEIEILKSDSKKVGAGIGIGIVISLLTGI